VSAGAQHSVINASPTADMNLYLMYSPANHKMESRIPKKEDADARETEFDGAATE